MINGLAQNEIYSYALFLLQQEIDSSLLARTAAPGRIAKDWDKNHEQN